MARSATQNAVLHHAAQPLVPVAGLSRQIRREDPSRRADRRRNAGESTCLSGFGWRLSGGCSVRRTRVWPSLAKHGPAHRTSATPHEFETDDFVLETSTHCSRYGGTCNSRWTRRRQVEVEACCADPHAPSSASAQQPPLPPGQRGATSSAIQRESGRRAARVGHGAVSSVEGDREFGLADGDAD